MSNPPIEMIKADGWEDQVWSEHAWMINWAAQKANWAAEHQDISFEEPKLGYVDLVTPEDGPFTSGQAWSSEQFVLYVDGRVTDPVYRTAAGWSIDVFHEVVHCARYERAIGGTVLELAATEGLAYIADELYRKQAFRSDKNSRFIELDLDPNPELLEEFIDVAKLNLETEMAKRWFLHKPYQALRNVDFLGMQRVYAQLERGYTIGDLINQPAGDVLGL